MFFSIPHFFLSFLCLSVFLVCLSLSVFPPLFSQELAEASAASSSSASKNDGASSQVQTRSSTQLHRHSLTDLHVADLCVDNVRPVYLHLHAYSAHSVNSSCVERSRRGWRCVWGTSVQPVRRRGVEHAEEISPSLRASTYLSLSPSTSMCMYLCPVRVFVLYCVSSVREGRVETSVCSLLGRPDVFVSLSGLEWSRDLSVGWLSARQKVAELEEALSNERARSAQQEGRLRDLESRFIAAKKAENGAIERYKELEAKYRDLKSQMEQAEGKLHRAATLSGLDADMKHELNEARKTQPSANAPVEARPSRTCVCP